jgi:molybdopterin converting factor small subunit
MATLLYFGWARDCAGTGSEEIEIDGTIGPEQLWELILERHPRLQECRSASRLAVDMQYVGSNAEMGNDAEIAIIPPVAGG